MLTDPDPHSPSPVARLNPTTPLRHTPEFRCPVCNGHAGLPHGRGMRCAGFTLQRVTYCTREQFAGGVTLDLSTDPPSYRHQRFGRCACGVEHRGEAPPPLPPLADVTPRPQLAAELAGAIYAQALALLTLRPEALHDLTRRGLSPAAASALGYRSIPHRGNEHQTFIATLVSTFGESVLRQCPGFTDKNGRITFWTAVTDRDGYVVPYRDARGQIRGLQLRLLGGRYRTATGTRLDTVYHLAGPPHSADLYLTEGATKANVAHALGDITVFAVAGQSLKRTHVEAIKRLAPRRVIVALDEEENPRTDQARERWLRMLGDAGLSAYRAVWEGADVGGPKGIDDLLQAGRRPRIRAVPVPLAALGNPRRPYPVDQPGPVDRGGTLAAARRETARAIDQFVAAGSAHAGKARLIASAPGTGKSTALAQAFQRHRSAARVLVGTKHLAAELAAEHGYVLVTGRSAENCERFDVVQRLGEAGHDVERLACGTPAEPHCPVRAACRYWAQFQQPGPRVAATEQLFNPPFLAGGSILALDDAELARSLVNRCSVPADVITRALDQLVHQRREPVRAVLQLLLHAITDAPAQSLIGPAVWDQLATTAARYSCDLVAVLNALPATLTLPEPDRGAHGDLTAAAVDAAPPATILQILNALRAELSSFQSGEDFNSGLRLSARGIEAWTLREPVSDRQGVPLLPRMALLVLDATPVDALVAHVMRDHERLPDVRATVQLPANVTVVQYAASSNGHTVLAADERLQVVIAEIEDERTRHPVADPRDEAVVVFKRHRTQLVQLGFAESQVLSFGSARGTNALASVERLHVVGRPMPPADDLVLLAQAIHHDGAPVSAQLAVAPRTYGGQRVGVDVIDFADPRLSALLRATRDDELTQVMHRARLLTLEPQLGLDGPEPRRQVRVVLHTSHVVPGLRVDQLHLRDAPPRNLNQQRAQDAGNRIREAIATLIAGGEPLTDSAIARLAGAQRRTVAKALRNGLHSLRVSAAGVASDLGTPVQTVNRDPMKGVHTLPQTIPGSSPTSVSAVASARGYAPCRGGCGTAVPTGQQCFRCACRAVDAAFPDRVRRRSPAPLRPPAPPTCTDGCERPVEASGDLCAECTAPCPRFERCGHLLRYAWVPAWRAPGNPLCGTCHPDPRAPARAPCRVRPAIAPGVTGARARHTERRSA